MKTVFFAAVGAMLCAAALLTLVSCNTFAKEASTPIESESDCAVSSTDAAPTTQSSCRVQQILDTIYDNVELRGGRIYLSFGARGTLTVENFNTLILERQLGLSTDRFTFVMDDSQLHALKHNNAYGGIGFDQDWVATLCVQLKDNETGEISEPELLFFSLHKSREAEREFNGIKP